MNLSDQITHVLAKRGWSLINQTETRIWNAFVEEAAALAGQIDVTQPVDQTRLDRAVIGAYCPVLHAVCAEDGSERQRRAFEELWRWVYPRVYQRVDSAEDAEDVSQEVMRKVYENLHQVTDPRGFLAWVNKISFRTLTRHYKNQDRRKQREEGAIDAGENGDALDALADPVDLLEVEVSIAEDDLVRMIFDCLSEGRRRQAEVLVALVFEELTVAEVAQTFETTPANIHLLYFRARTGLLKSCQELVETLIQNLTPSQREERVEANS